MREGPGESVRAGVDGALVLLPESPSTGYRWHLDVAPPHVAVRAAMFQELGEGARTIGASGTRAFLLTAPYPDPVEVVFVLRRPWETDAIERRVITILPATGGDAPAQPGG